ncbi:MAG: hypothetical protein JWN40_2573 [Phycisphaerales bacterium]|nr:hypothetical protein [Phycisphaerales bacterium]
MKKWQLPAYLLSASLFFNATGCVNSDRYFGHLGATENSFDREEEAVDLKMLDETELQSEAAKLGIDSADAMRNTQSIALAAAVIPFIVDTAFKFVKSELDKEAQRYEQQFKASAFAADFWNGSTANWKGFLLTRHTKNDTKTREGTVSDPAFVMLCVMKPVEQGKFLLVRPLYVKTNRAKAKLIGSHLTTEISITEENQWVDQDGVLQNRQTAVVSWTEAMKLGEEFKYNLPSNSAKDVGALVGPPRSVDSTTATSDAPNLSTKGGLMKLTVLVTEKDPTNAKQIVESVAKFVEEKRPDVVAAVKKKFSTTQNSSTSTTKP